MNKILLLAIFLFADIALADITANGFVKKACLENLTADPTPGCAEGRLFWDSDDNLFRFHTGAAWRTVADTTTALVNPSTTGVVIDGTVDENQLRVQAHSTQTNDILVVEKSDGTDLLQVTNVNGTKIKGTTTNDAAAEGFVGEYLIQSRVRSANTGLTTATTANVTATALTLTAGEWDIGGSVTIVPSNSSTSITGFAVAISLTSATLPSADTTSVPTGGESRSRLNFAVVVPGTSGDITQNLPTTRVQISASTTFYLVVNATFTVSTLAGYGSIWARRVR